MLQKKDGESDIEVSAGKGDQIEDNLLGKNTPETNQNHKSASTLIDEIQAHARDAGSLQTSQYYSDNDGGQEIRARYFNQEKEIISKALELAHFMSECPYQDLKALPYAMLFEIEQAFSKIKPCLHEMRDHADGRYEKKTTVLKEVENIKSQLLEQFNNAFSDFYKLIQPIKNDFNRQEIFKLKQEVTVLRDENTKQGIEKYHRLFSHQAIEHAIAAKSWLIFGVFAVAVNIGCVVWLMYTFENAPADPYSMANNLVLKFVLLGLLSYMALWSFKNFKLNKHNELLNRQKELSLRTFKKFASSVGPEDKDLRQVILNKITATIFDPQPLGYLENDNNKSDNYTFSPIIDAAMNKN